MRIPLLLSAFLALLAPAKPQIATTPETVHFSDKGIEAVFAKTAAGGLRELRDSPAGRNLLAETPGQWFRLTLAKRTADGKLSQTTLHAREAQSFELQAENGVLVGRATDFANCKGLHVIFRIRITGEKPALAWRFRVDIPDSFILEQLDAPLVNVALPLGKIVEDDAVVLGTTKGGVLQQPSTWRNRKTISAPNPGRLAAQFACVYDKQGGLETETHDALGYPKVLYFQKQDAHLSVYWRHATFATKNFATAYDTLLRPFSSPDPKRPTDWRDAADIYKSWAQTQPWCAHTYAERKDLPKWLQEGPAMVRFNRRWLSNPDTIRHWLARYWEGLFAAPAPLIVAFWGWENKETWVGSEYFPPYPSGEQFRALSSEIRAAGNHVFLWPSGYHWTIAYRGNDKDGYFYDDRERYRRLGPPHTVRQRDGSLLHRRQRWLRGGTNAYLCNGDPWTRSWFTDIAEGCVDWGADMVQVDQVVSGYTPVCYSDKHGHPVGNGLWRWQAFIQQLEDINRRCLPKEAGLVLGVEEPQELFIPYVGVQDYRDAQVADRHKQVPLHSPTSVFGYLYHEYLPVFQSNPRSNDPINTAYCIAMGQRPHFVPQTSFSHDRFPINGSFEDWNHNVPASWDKVSGWKGEIWDGKCDRAEDETNGKSCLRLDCEAGKTVQVSQNVQVGNSPGGLRIGGKYRLRLRFKSQNVAAENSLRFACLTSKYKGISGGTFKIPATTNNQWRSESAEFEVPKGSQCLRIMLHLNGPGTVWVDDLLLLEIKPDGTEEPIKSSDPVEYGLVKQWCRLFSGEGRPWLLHGRMLHPPKLDTKEIPYAKGTTRPAVFHNAFQAPDGRKALLLVNATGDQQDLRVSWENTTLNLTLKKYEIRLLRDNEPH